MPRTAPPPNSTTNFIEARITNDCSATTTPANPGHGVAWIGVIRLIGYIAIKNRKDRCHGRFGNAASRTIARRAVARRRMRAAGFGDRLRVWFAAEGAWYAASFVLHMVMACVLMLLSVTVKHKLVDTAPAIEEAQAEEKAKQDTKLDKFEVGETPLESHRTQHRNAYPDGGPAAAGTERRIQRR